MPQVRMPDNTIVSFPDDMPPEQIKSIIASKFSPQEITPGRTALDQTLQGATFGYGDEISNRIGAGIAKAYGNLPNMATNLGIPNNVESPTNNASYADLLNEANQNSKMRLLGEQEKYPIPSAAAQITGALLTGGGAPAKLGKMALEGSTGAKIAKSALLGAGGGALYGSGTADEGNRLEGAQEGGAEGALFGAAIPTAGAAVPLLGQGLSTLKQGIQARSPEALQEAASGIKKAAVSMRDQMKDVGAILTPEKSFSFVKDLENALANKEIIPELTPKTLAIVNRIKQVANDGNLDLDKLDQYRRLLGKTQGEDSAVAGAVRRTLDNTVNKLTPDDLVTGDTSAVDLLNNFREAYAKGSRMDDIAEILTKADGDPNKIKSGLTRFLNNNNQKPPGFNEEEISALKDAARSNTSEKLLKMFGKFGIDLGTSLTPGNTVGPVVGGLLGGAIGGVGSGGLVPLFGTVARQGQKYMARGKAEQLFNTLESR